MKKIVSLICLFLFTQQFVAQKIVETVNCDSIYTKKGFSVSLEFDQSDESWDEEIPNIIFTFSKKTQSKTKILYKEKLFSHFKNVEFIDFNGDGVKDILVENGSDVRSNVTYNLFLFDINKEKLTKVKGFNEIKNPNYLKEYDLIDCLVMSGKNRTSFYKIIGNKVKDFGYTIYMGEDENGEDYNYEDNYEKTLNKILKSQK